MQSSIITTVTVGLKERVLEAAIPMDKAAVSTEPKL